MPSPIVVGVALRDDDRAPIALAEALARLTGAPLALVTSYPYGLSPLFVTPELISALEEQAERAIAGTAEGVAAGIEVSTHVRPSSSAPFALHDLASELDAAAIVVGSSHRGSVGRVLAGDVAASVLHGAPCPVAIAPRGYAAHPEGFRRIGVGFVDTIEGRGALTAANGLAAATGASVDVFAVEEPLAWSPALAAPGWSFPEAFVTEREAHAQQTRSTAEKLTPADVLHAVEAPIGNPVEILTGASNDVDLFVCGSRGYGPLKSVMLGSVSRALAHSAGCPLLVVPRPPAQDATRLWRTRAVATSA